MLHHSRWIEKSIPQFLNSHSFSTFENQWLLGGRNCSWERGVGMPFAGLHGTLVCLWLGDTAIRGWEESCLSTEGRARGVWPWWGQSAHPGLLGIVQHVGHGEWWARRWTGRCCWRMEVPCGGNEGPGEKVSASATQWSQRAWNHLTREPSPYYLPSAHVGGDRDGQTLTTQMPALCLSWEGGAEVSVWMKFEVSVPWTKILCFWTEICLVTSEGFERMLHERRKQENLRTGQESKGRCSRWNNLKGLEGNNNERGWDYTTCAACSMLGLQVENHQVRVPRTSLMRSVILKRLFLHQLATERRAI